MKQSGNMSTATIIFGLAVTTSTATKIVIVFVLSVITIFFSSHLVSPCSVFLTLRILILIILVTHPRHHRSEVTIGHDKLTLRFDRRVVLSSRRRRPCRLRRTLSAVSSNRREQLLSSVHSSFLMAMIMRGESAES